MFLMLVISSVSSPRIWSDMSRSASVLSWKNGQLSTIDQVVGVAQAAR